MDPEQVRNFEIICCKPLPGIPSSGKNACLRCGDLPARKIEPGDEHSDAGIVSGDGVGPVKPVVDGEFRGPAPDSPDFYQFPNDCLFIHFLPEHAILKRSNIRVARGKDRKRSAKNHRRLGEMGCQLHGDLRVRDLFASGLFFPLVRDSFSAGDIPFHAASLQSHQGWPDHQS